MAQSAITLKKSHMAPVRATVTTGSGDLPGLPRGPLTPTEQLEAIRRVQSKAEQRIKLGLQLYKAAEAHTTTQQVLINEVKQEQERLRNELQTDVAHSLQAYDQWVGKIDENFTRAMHLLEDKITRMETQWQQTQENMDRLMRRCEALFDQSRCMLEDGPAPSRKSAPVGKVATAVSADSPADHRRNRLKLNFPASRPMEQGSVAGLPRAGETSIAKAQPALDAANETASPPAPTAGNPVREDPFDAQRVQKALEMGVHPGSSPGKPVRIPPGSKINAAVIPTPAAFRPQPAEIQQADEVDLAAMKSIHIQPPLTPLTPYSSGEAPVPPISISASRLSPLPDADAETPSDGNRVSYEDILNRMAKPQE